MMLSMILYIIEWILFLYLSICVTYIAVFSMAAHCHKHPINKNVNSKKRFAVLIPAYKEDKVIEQCVTSVLQQNYPGHLFETIVISDQMRHETNELLKQKGIRLLEINVQNSSKAKALQTAAEYIKQQQYDNVLILDADNIIPTNYLHELNQTIHDSIAVQTHRKFQKIHTDIALLDAVIEEMNNSIFRKGQIRLGLSSALIGSGMIFEYNWFIKNIFLTHSAGEDKELEELLLRQKIQIKYLEDIEVFDEKASQKTIIKNQRRRWIATQFFLAAQMIRYLPTAIIQGNMDYILKTIQELILPRSILLGCIFLLACISSIFTSFSSEKWWILLGILIFSLYIAIPKEMKNKRLWNAIKQAPFFIIMMIKNLFHLKGGAHKFIHTQHGQ